MSSDDRNSTVLNLHRTRLVRGYSLAMLLIAGAALSAFLILQSAQKKQFLIESLLNVTHELQVEINDSFAHTSDLKEFSEAGGSGRLLKKIRIKIEEDHQQIVDLSSKMQVQVDRLSASSGIVELDDVYRKPPYELQSKLDDHASRIQRLLSNEKELTGGFTSSWMPVDAVGATAGNLLAGTDRMHEVLVQASKDNGENLTRKQMQGMGFIVLILALSTLFIFRPLMGGLRRAHREVMLATGELETQAFFDSETGLPNEAGLIREFSEKNLPDSVLVMQLTNPVVVSQIAGLEHRGEFFRLVNSRLQSIFGVSEVCARTGDNEFAIVFDNKNAHSDLFDWDSIRKKLSAGYSVNQKTLSPEFSLGVSDSGDLTITLGEKLDNARLAILCGKQDARVSIFDPSMRTRSEEENLMIEKIRGGITADEFLPFYQLKIDPATEKPCGMEALCRWIRADGSIVYPDQFIPIAEASGLIVDITWILLRKICADIESWQSSGLLPGAVAFNAAASSLQEPDFVDRLTSMADPLTNGYRPLELEVTENVALADDDAFYTAVLGRVRENGFHVAMDDFGTGYASLSSIVGLEVDVIKIDQSFVRVMAEDKASYAVVETVINISKVLGVSCVAEGVETETEANMLKMMGCNQLQGYHYHKPAPFEEVTERLGNDSQQTKAA